MDLAGVFPALTTPFAADGGVSLEDVKHNIRRYNETELAGASVANIENGFIRSNVDFTAASGWLQRFG